MLKLDFDDDACSSEKSDAESGPSSVNDNDDDGATDSSNGSVESVESVGNLEQEGPLKKTKSQKELNEDLLNEVYR